MQIFSNILTFYKKNYLAIISIIGLTFLVWHKILNQVFLGEGYIYFNKFAPYTFITSHGLLNIGRSDNFARFVFDIFPPLFKDNIQYYFLFELIIIIILYISLYSTVAIITKSKLIGFLSTVFFLANYVGSFYLIADGNYQRFIQRIPNFIPIIFSFYFLYKFFNKSNILFYFISLILFAIAIFMSHFSSLILPLFLIYPYVQLINQKRDLKIFLSRSLIALSFLIISFFITHWSEQAPQKSITVFLLTEPHLIEKVLYQIPLITIPLDIVLLASKYLSPPISEPYTQLMPIFTAISIIAYSLGGLIVYKKARSLLVMYITVLLSMLGSILLYIYVDSRLDPLKYYGADRFFMISSMLAAISWGIVFGTIFNKKAFKINLIILALISIFVYYNTTLIYKHIDSIQYKSEMIKSFTVFVKAHSSQYNNKTVIIVPSYLQWPGPLITEIINPEIKVNSVQDGWERKYWDIKENVFVFDYEFEKNVDKTTHPYAGHIVDFSEKYRKGEKINFLN